MNNRYVRKGGLAAVALAFVTLVAWKAPEPKAAAVPSTPAATAPATTSPANVPVATYAPVVQRVMPAVVTIRVEKKAAMEPTEQQVPDNFFRQFFGDQWPQMQRGQRMPQPVEHGVGSGVIVTQNGYILTNNHVVDGATTVQVDLPDNRQYTAKVIGRDSATDLAVVKIDAANLPTLPLGDSDAARVGDIVLAIGNPLDVGETVTSGIISAKSRSNIDGNDPNAYQDFIQTDAPINHGNSGGALVNTDGQLIGINSEILSPNDANIGLGFAIPSNMAKNVMDQLIKNGKVRRAKLGVLIQQITPDMATAMNLPNTEGAVVASVDAGSPAAQAGLKQGDVITEFNGKPVKDSNELRNEVSSMMPGTSVSLAVLRNGRTENVKATLSELDSTPATADDHSGTSGSESGRFGMTVQPLTPDIAQQLGVPNATRGVVVTAVDPSGAAANSQIQEGDVILKVNGQDVTSASQLRSALDTAGSKPSLLLVQRKDQQSFLTLRAQ
ncbi:MAG: DegQ family serine endoprotease [Vicinamibacterales bacterium]